MDYSILDYEQRTRLRGSRSERVNKLLLRAILDEQCKALIKEAVAFFAAAGKGNRSTQGLCRSKSRLLHSPGAESVMVWERAFRFDLKAQAFQARSSFGGRVNMVARRPDGAIHFGVPVDQEG